MISLVIEASTAENKKTAVYTVVIIFVVLVAIILVLAVLYRRHLKNKYALYLEPNEHFVVSEKPMCIYNIHLQIKYFHYLEISESVTD